MYTQWPRKIIRECAVCIKDRVCPQTLAEIYVLDFPSLPFKQTVLASAYSDFFRGGRRKGEEIKNRWTVEGGTTNEEEKSDRYSIKREIYPVISRANDFLPPTSCFPFDSFEPEDKGGGIFTRGESFRV